MNRILYSIAAALVLAGAMSISCAKDAGEAQDLANGMIERTRAEGGKPLEVMVYYEINDTNPLNALSYEMDGAKFIDIVQLFAANIHKDAYGDPAIFFNDKLAPVMADAATYVAPLRAAGIKIILSVIGDWQGVGVGNLTQAQADKFAAILTWIVDTYELDGVSLNDAYANYASTLSGSFARVVKALRTRLDAKFPGDHKIINVLQLGNFTQIDAAAGAMIDQADHYIFGANTFYSSCSIHGIPADRWMPQALAMGNRYMTAYLRQIQMRSTLAVNGGFFGIKMFNVRKASEVDPLPVFQAISDGAFGGRAVTGTGVEYPQDWIFIPAGKTIAYSDLPIGY
ncbi:glycosyl hydrolase family 18 protein [uncultured Alistipes sp.]|uniref:glycosyl hydrolase family 18 protein n=1 Tax=uncultured Alistipes sp. TaxID=538949 RepID=UPI0025D3289E|nr:glycosyl hydrolase family 18 protein [uncultured Alistipes sp.]